MKHLTICIAFLMMLSPGAWATEGAEERMNEVIALQSKAAVLKVLEKAWSAYQEGDYTAASDLWKPLAEAGNASAQVFVGMMYNQGHGVDQDEKKAAEWYILASQQGYSPAQWRLAIMYYYGSGVGQDYQEAAKYYSSAARQGDSYAQNALGVMLRDGVGLLKDNTLAYLWFHIAGDNGFELGTRYRDAVAIEMSQDEILTSQIMVKKCISSGYTKCGY